ncbi:MAG: type II secretion system protein [Planctomycetota bacterium]
MVCSPSINRSRFARGFSMIELLVAMGIIGILVAIILPTLGNVRKEAIEQKGLVHLKTTHEMFTMYTIDFKEYWPYFTDPRDGARVEVGNARATRLSQYFDASVTWPLALADMYYSGETYHETTYWPDSRRLSLVYSPSFLASPEYWREDMREGRHQWVPTRFGQVRYPDDKGLITFLDRQTAPGTADVPSKEVEFVTAFVDGHVGRFEELELHEPHPEGEGPREMDGVRISTGFPVLHTVGGLLGRDLRHEALASAVRGAASENQ